VVASRLLRGEPIRVLAGVSFTARSLWSAAGCDAGVL